MIFDNKKLILTDIELITTNNIHSVDLPLIWFRSIILTDFSGTSILSNEFVVIGRASTDNLGVLLGRDANLFSKFLSRQLDNSLASSGQLDNF